MCSCILVQAVRLRLPCPCRTFHHSHPCLDVQAIQGKPHHQVGSQASPFACHRSLQHSEESRPRCRGVRLPTWSAPHSGLARSGFRISFRACRSRGVRRWVAPGCTFVTSWSRRAGRLPPAAYENQTGVVDFECSCPAPSPPPLRGCGTRGEPAARLHCACCPAVGHMLRRLPTKRLCSLRPGPCWSRMV